MATRVDMKRSPDVPLQRAALLSPQRAFRAQESLFLVFTFIFQLLSIAILEQPLIHVEFPCVSTSSNGI